MIQIISRHLEPVLAGRNLCDVTTPNQVFTRTQADRESRIAQAELDRFADDDNNFSVADHYSGNYFHEKNGEAMF